MLRRGYRTWLSAASAMVMSVALVAGSPCAAAQGAAPSKPLQVRVDKAIDGGVAWLRSIQREDGTFPLSPMGLDQLGAKARAAAGLSGSPSENWAGGPWHKGLDALAVYALVVCDVSADDPAIKKGFAALRRHWDGRPTGEDVTSAEGVSTYFVSLCLLALDAHYNRGVGELAKGPPDPKSAGKKLMGRKDYAWALALLDWLARAQDPGAGAAGGASTKRKRKKLRAPKASKPPSLADGGGFSYECEDRSWTFHDHSNSQFAVLGMKAASRLGVEVPDAMWLRALRHFIAAQEAEGPEVDRVEAQDAAGDGSKPARRSGATSDEPIKDRARGWAYGCRGSSYDPERNSGPAHNRGPTGPMTTGGVSTLVICRSELDGVKGFTPELSTLTETSIRDGLAWLARELAKPPNRPVDGASELARRFAKSSDPLEDFYFLYGMERACVLAAVAHLGKVAWWETGAERILSSQQESGAFLSNNMSNGNGHLEIDTAFALLFLKRAVFRTVDKRAVTPSGK